MAITPKQLKEITDLAKKRVKIEKQITEETKKAADMSGEAYIKEKARLKQEGEKLKILKKQQKLSKGILDSTEELLDIGDEYAAKSYDIAAAQEKQEKMAREMNKLMGNNSALTKTEFSIIKKKFATQSNILKTNQDMAKETQTRLGIEKKLLANLGLAKGAMKGMVAQAKLFLKAMLGNPILLMLAALVAVVKMLSMGVKQAFDFQDQLGTSATQSIKLAAKLTLVNKTLSILGVDGTKIAGELADNLGGIGAVTEENVKYFGLMQKSLGITSETGIQVFKAMESISVGGEAAAKATLEFTAALAESNNVAPGAIMNDIAANTEMFAEFGKDGGKNIAKAAVQARKLGVNLATTAKIADSLLDFESSIEKEMEASMLIGKQLNYNKARALALEGDLAGAAADVVKQIGGKAELEKMNVLQRRALAESIGVSVDELSKLAGGKMEVKDADADIKKQQAAVTKGLTDATDAAQKVMKVLIIALGVLTAAVLANSIAQMMGFKGIGKIGKTGILKGLKKTGTKVVAKAALAKAAVKKGGSKLAGKVALATAGKKVLTKQGGGVLMKATGKKVYGAAAKSAVKSGAGKIAGKALVKGALKKIPFVGAIVGVGLGLSRLMKGDWAGALGEVASGAAAIIPGLGTGVSLAIDAGLAARDISKANKLATEGLIEAGTEVEATATAEQELIEQKVSVQDEQDPDTMRKMVELQGTDSETTRVYQEKSIVMLQQIVDANNATGTKVVELIKE